jgi:hypothetical protein
MPGFTIARSAAPRKEFHVLIIILGQMPFVSPNRPVSYARPWRKRIPEKDDSRRARYKPTG